MPERLGARGAASIRLRFAAARRLLMRRDMALRNIIRLAALHAPWSQGELASAVRRLVLDRAGASYVEYLVLLTFVGLGSIATLKHLCGSVSELGALVAAHVATLTPLEPASLSSPASGQLGREPGAPIGPTGPGVFDPRDIDPRRPPSDVEGKVNLPNGAGYRVRIKSSHATALEPNGQHTATLEVTRSSNWTQKAQLKWGTPLSEDGSGRWSAKLELFDGDGLSYRIKLPEAEYERILRGEAPFPNPGDLSTLPDGSSVLLREEDLSATELAGSYEIFKLASRHTDSHGSAVALEVRGDRVRVLAGPTESVSELTVLGVEAKGKSHDVEVGFEAAFERTKSLRYYELDYADISARHGQAAFAEFMRSGHVPQPDRVGVLQAGTVRKLDYDDASNAKLSLSLGEFDLTSRLLNSSSSARNTDVLRPDGSHEMTWIVHEKGIGVFETKTLAPDGRAIRGQSGLLLDGVDPSYGHAIGEAYGVRSEDKPYDLQLEMSQADYTALRNRAIDWMDGHTELSDARVAELRRKGSDPGPTINPVVDAIVQHTDANEFFADVKLRKDGPSNVTEWLLGLYTRTSERGPLPGHMHFYPND
jgi:Flp pilus assembly pilin Flp